jgi:hypothetical protein
MIRGLDIGRTVLQARKEVHTSMQGSLPVSASPADNLSVSRRPIPFVEALEAAAKPYRELWRDNGKLSLAGLRRHYDDRGHPVSDASLSRIFAGKQAPGEDVIEATHRVFGIQKGILRGEPVSAEMEKALTDYRLSTLLLAQRLESLPKDDYYLIAQAIDRALEHQKKLREALETSPNVTQIDRRKR